MPGTGGFPGCRAFIAKTKEVPGKPGQFITLGRRPAHCRTWSIPGPHSTVVPQTLPYISRGRNCPWQVLPRVLEPLVGAKVGKTMAEVRWVQRLSSLFQQTPKCTKERRRGSGGDANKNSMHGGRGDEDIDSVYKHLVKFSFMCGSYSQVIAGFHRIFELTYIVMQDVHT